MRKERNRDSNDLTNGPETAVAEEGQDMVAVGQVYKSNDGGKEVIPFFMDFPSATVHFAPVGGAREDRMRSSDFLGAYTLVGPVSENMGEKPKDLETQAAENTKDEEEREARFRHVR